MKGMIDWFAGNTVAANLLMFILVAAGLMTLPAIKREVFPEIPTEIISVTVAYPGAAPEEVEEAVCIRVEEAVQGLEGVKRVTSVAAENLGSVSIEALEGTDIRRLLDDVKAQVDAIDTFPEDTEEPNINELVIENQVVNVAVYGDTDETSLRILGERIEDEIAALPGITQTKLVNVRPYEISIEVSEDALQRYGITFDQVAGAVRRSSLDLPGGTLKAEGGEILLRTKGQAYREREFENIVLLSRTDGAEVRLGDVARVVDGFAETDQWALFDGLPTVTIQVFRVGEQDALDLSRKVRQYIADAGPRMPEGVRLTIWQDYAAILQSRQDLLVRNGRAGFVLVFLVLATFLRLRLAFWVSLGIPISFLGAIWLMPTLDVSVNLISLFAFIIVLGIVVDDAIVVGENVYSKLEKGMPGLQAAREGAKEMVIPVVFAIFTSVAAFSPLLGIGGRTGQVMRVIPLIVIPTLLFSLIECLFILPAHLSHLKPSGKEHPVARLNQLWRRFQERVARGLDWLIRKTYQPSLDLGLRYRYVTVAVFAFFLFMTVGLVGRGTIKFVFFPKVEADYMIATVTMPQGTPAAVTARAVEHMRESAEQLRDEHGDGKGAVRHILATVGDQPQTTAQGRGGPGGTEATFNGSHLGEVAVELQPAEDRNVTSAELVARWRELTGDIPDALELSFNASLFSTGEPVNIQLAGTDTERLEAAAAAIKTRLADYTGVFDITDSYEEGKEEIKLGLKPGAEATGVTLAALARQVRQAFYGEEAQRIQRGRDEIKVMIRYPLEERRSISDLVNMRIRTPSGEEVPFSALATAEFGRGYAAIQRTDRKRTLTVTADVDQNLGNANEILADVEARVLPAILAEHPGVSYSLEGEQQQQRETMADLRRGFLMALLAIYALMAIPFKSYLQPLVVMSAIPFGLIGAIWGHVVLGLNLTILSLFGIVALTGVVVNDSIVLVDYINRCRRGGMDLHEAVHTAGSARFRAILLTSLTTVAGLTPIMLERSMQAQFLIPIAVSLAFGVLFATFITLVLVPASYLIMEDLILLPGRIRGFFLQPGGIEKASTR